MLEVLASEATKAVVTAAVGRADVGLARLVKLVGAKLGRVPPAAEDVREQVLAACERDPEFGAELMDALARLNLGNVRAQAPEGIERFRNQVEHLEAPPESGLRLVCGPPGSGKTELARQLVGRVRERFPSGCIELDLADDRRGDVLDLALVKRKMLLRLGIPGSEIEIDDASLDQQFITVLAARRFAVILNNVTSARDLEPFRPFRSSLVLATVSVMTRDLAELDRAPILLRGLDPAGAREMLADYCGQVRLEDEPDSTAKLLEATGRLPSAIREVGLSLARRAGEPYPVARLREYYDRTKIVDAEGVLRDAVERTFAALPPATVQATALLAEFPGHWFTRQTATAYLGDSDEKAFDAVLDAQLIESLNGWHRLTALAREHASRLPGDRDAAFSRLLGYVRDRVVAADLAGGEDRLREYVVPAGLAWSSPEDRFDWLHRHLGLIAELTRAAFERGRYQEVCQLAGGIEVLINQRWLWREFAEIGDWAVRAADSLREQPGKGRPALLARALSMRAKAWYLARGFERAAVDLERAWELAEAGEIPHRRRQRLRSSVAEFRARFFEEQADALGTPGQPPSDLAVRSGLLRRAEAWLRLAVEIDQELQHGYALAIHLRMLASVLVKAGRAGEAIATANLAEPHAKGRNLNRLEMVLARAYLADADAARARQCWRRANAALVAGHTYQYQWELREIDARILGAEGNADAAATAWGRLIYDAWAVGHPRANEYLKQCESSR